MIFLSFWQLMLRGKNKYINIYFFLYVYWIFIHSSLILEKTLMVGGVLTVRFRIYIYLRFGHINLYIEFLYIVHWFWKKRGWWGGGSNCTVSYIYIYIRFGEYSASWWCPGISFTFKFIFFRNFNLKKYQKIDFSSFWHVLVLMAVFFFTKFDLKSIKKLIFPAFGTILVLAAAFFYSKFNQKSIKKLIFRVFGTILVLMAAFFHSKFNLKSIRTFDFSSFWQDLGFGGSFFLFKI